MENCLPMKLESIAANRKAPVYLMSIPTNMLSATINPLGRPTDNDCVDINFEFIKKLIIAYINLPEYLCEIIKHI